MMTKLAASFSLASCRDRDAPAGHRGDRPSPSQVGCKAAIIAALLMSGGAARAGNGLNPLGSGLESSAMAGADLGVARDPLALNTNPAGLTQLMKGTTVELHVAALSFSGTEHDDQFGETKGLTNEIIPLGDLGIAYRLEDYPITLGAGLFAVGGAGPTYKELDTPFGGTDEASLQLGIVRAAVGGAVGLTDRLSLGGSAGLSYANLSQKFFPDKSVFDPSDPAGTFFGTELTQASAFGTGARLGLRYEVTDRLALGAVYASKVDLPADSDRLVVNLDAVGIGRVQYRDATVDGFAQAQELGVGLAWRPIDSLLVAADITWLDWSSALRRLKIKASDPDDPRAPPKVSNRVTLNWRDQYVVAVGVAYKVSEAVIGWGGYNYGRNPIPGHDQSPFLPNIAEHHLTAGLGWHLPGGWRVGLSGEYWVPNEVTYTNQELPFGSNVEERSEYFALHFGVSATW